MFKLDLHTHSVLSPSGGISAEAYRDALQHNRVDAIAITDKGSIDFAQRLHRELGDVIIVGQEIETSDGLMIGLYLDHPIQGGASAAETAQLIKNQGGIVYIPYPFDTLRHGLHPAVIEAIQDTIDIIEVCNGRRIRQADNAQAVVWARMNHKAAAASSDALYPRELGKTYTRIKAIPTKELLVSLIKNGTPITDSPGIGSFLPKRLDRFWRKS